MDSHFHFFSPKVLLLRNKSSNLNGHICQVFITYQLNAARTSVRREIETNINYVSGTKTFKLLSLLGWV